MFLVFAAAFEIESTTSIYSGILRMSDLIAMQPNLKIPLYLVAPDGKRVKVMKEVCRYISFSALRENIQKVAYFGRYLNPESLKEFSESCVLEDV